MKHLSFFFMLLLCISAANAQWNSDTTVRNIICAATGTQSTQHLCSDGALGAYIIWQDYKTSPSRIYAQHIDYNGYTLWQTNGKAVNDTTIAGGCHDADITTDGKNGAFMVWSRDYYTNTYILAEHINSAGKLTWKHTLRVDTVNDARGPKLTPDGHGGAIINWHAYDGGGGLDVYFQWIDSTGRMRFPTQTGLKISLNGSHYSTFTVTDNNYNAFVIFSDGDTLKVVKVDTSGNFPWGQRGKILTNTFVNYPTNFEITADGKGGVVAAWDDHRRSPIISDLYAQRINSSGTFLWNSTGVLIDSVSYNGHAYVYPVTDGNGGAFICFGYNKVFMQHVSSGGTHQWSAIKRAEAYNTGQSYPSIDADGHNGVIAAWDDGRGNPNVYAMRFDSSGNYLWEPAGAPVFTGPIPGAATGTQIISLGNGYAIAAFNVNGDIYAAKFTGLQISTGITSIQNNNDWLVYPNPSNGYVYLKNNSAHASAANIQVFNTIGQLVQEEKLPLSSLAQQGLQIKSTVKGIYLLRITDNTGVSNYRLVVE